MTAYTSKQKAGTLFPTRLYQLLEDAEKEGNEDVVCWMPCGKAFKVHDRERFEGELMPRYFSSSKFRSFQKSLSMWDFATLSLSVKSPRSGISRHQFFVRGSPELLENMKRNKIPEKLKEKQKQVPEKDNHRLGVVTDLTLLDRTPPSRSVPSLNAISLDCALRAGINSRRHSNDLAADAILGHLVGYRQGGLGHNDTAAVPAYLQRPDLVAPASTFQATSNPTNQELLSNLASILHGHRQVVIPDESTRRELLVTTILNILR